MRPAHLCAPLRNDNKRSNVNLSQIGSGRCEPFSLLEVRRIEAADTMARVYADVNQQMPRAYWDYDSVNITWGVLENYEVVRKIGSCLARGYHLRIRG